MEIEPIKYYSTNGRSGGISFREALLKGLAPDGGLFMPDKIPIVSHSELESFREKEYHEIAFDILNKYFSGEIDSSHLKEICRDAYDFDVPLEKVTGRSYILRLDRGPTASFKDFAARMMSRLMNHFLEKEKRQLTILTATSGDTGSAVASAFHGLGNIKVIILFPVDEVSLIQRKQMTTLGGNITIIGVRGKFDDCQSMVKKAFNDESLSHLPLSSANSINIGRLLPQTVYYFYAWSRLALNTSDKAVFSVPSGNFGNLTAGLFAMRMGLPAERFIVATNSNDEVPEFLRTRSYAPIVPSKNCISSAMNVGHPSNLARLISLYGGSMDEKGTILTQPSAALLDKDFFGTSVSDEETKNTLSDIYKKHGTILEPHGAVAWKGVTEYQKISKNDNQLVISLETAHPAKFSEEIERILNISPSLPPALESLGSKEEKYEITANNYADLKKLILQKA